MQESRDLHLRMVLPWAVGALLLSIAPYLIAWLLASPGKVFGGTLANHNDFSAYVAAMRQGAAGKWLFHFNFSPESWQPRLMLPAYMLAGKLIGPFSQAFVFWIGVLRALAYVAMLGGLVFWVRQALPGNARQQFTAWLLVVFGGGLGWLLWPTVFLSGSFHYLPDISMPELTTLLVSVNPPHYMGGLTLEIILFAGVLRMVRGRGGLKWACISALVAVSLGIVYVYHSAVVCGIIGVYMLALAWQKKQIPWRLWGYGALIVAPLLPLLFYYGYWANLESAWSDYVYDEISRVPPPPILGLAIGLGVLGALAAIGLRRWLNQGKELLVPIWLFATLLLMYVPLVPYSGRFTLGLLVPVGTLAAYGLEEMALPWLQSTHFFGRFARLTPTPYASLRRVIILLAVPSTLMAALFLVQNVVREKDFPNYMPAGELEAAAWLAHHTHPERDIILAHYPVGNYLPAIADTRVFLGQFFWTPDLYGKIELLERFWDADTPYSWREAFLNEWGITFIYQGTYERDIMVGTVQPLGQIVYQANGVTIYQVFPSHSVLQQP